jgi:uncharacterized protein
MVGGFFLKKHAKLLLVILCLFTLGLLVLIPSIKFDYDFEKFFPKEDKESEYYFKHREIYQSDNDFLLIALERNEGVFNIKFLNKVEDFKKAIEKVKYVDYVRSLTSENELFLLTGGTVGKKPFYSKSDSLLKNDSIRIYDHPNLINSIISKDGKSICLFIKHEDFLPGKKSKFLIEDILKLEQKFKFEKSRIAGRTIAQKFYIEKMSFELMLFVSISMILVVIFLWIAFRSLWGIILPQIVIVFSLIWVLGGMSITNTPINIILSILPSIMFVVAMSDVIHLVSRYLDALRSGMDKTEAIKVSLKEVGIATLLTSITTSIGFFTLMYINVQPIQSFGLVTGIGVLIAFIVTILVLPLLFYIFPSPKKITKPKDSQFWTTLLHKWFIKVLNNPIKVILISVGFLLIFIVFSFKLESNNFMMDDLRDDEPIKQDFDFLDKHYGGVRPIELAININKNYDCWDLEVLNEVEKLENYLEKVYGAKMNVSLNTFLKVLNQSSHLGNKEFYTLPTTKKEIKKLKRAIKIAEKGTLFKIVVDSTQQNMRISANIPDWGNLKVTNLNQAFLKFIDKNIDKKIISVKITGTAHLLDKNMSYLSNSLLQGIIMSVLIVTLIMGIVYKSWTIVLISLIPNIIPLIVLSGLMGMLNIDLKISTAIIFTISFGIAVDDTIHFLGKFRMELAKGKSKLLALKTTYLVTGKAMILTTLILCSGFLMLLFSSFMGTFVMGFMISITLFVALIADLTLLPVLLLLFYKPKQFNRKQIDK